MGWASASEIFDPVAQALIDADLDRERKVTVLATLIDKLRDGDWDTYDYSYDQFRHDPAVVEAFHRNGCAPLSTDDDTEAHLTYSGVSSNRDGRWMLECEEHGDLDLEVGTEGHDELIRRWFAHLAEQHDGDGQVDEQLLINREPAATP